MRVLDPFRVLAAGGGGGASAISTVSAIESKADPHVVEQEGAGVCRPLGGRGDFVETLPVVAAPLGAALGLKARDESMLGHGGLHDGVLLFEIQNWLPVRCSAGVGA